MDAESRWFYAVGLSAVLLGGFGLALRASGAQIPAMLGWVLVAVVLLGIGVIVLGQRKIRDRYRAWRASRPKPWPAGWKMEEKR